MSKSSFSFVRRHLRSLSLLAVLSLAVTGLSLGGYDALAATLKPNFKARDATQYPQNPNLAPYGMKNIIVAYENSLWPPGCEPLEGGHQLHSQHLHSEDQRPEP